jgi:hypothetical protein
MAILFVSLDLAKPRGHTARRAPGWNWPFGDSQQWRSEERRHFL